MRRRGRRVHPGPRGRSRRPIARRQQPHVLLRERVVKLPPMGAKTCRIPALHPQRRLQLPIPLPQVNRHFRPFIRPDQHRNRLQSVPTKSHHLPGHQLLEPPDPRLHRSPRRLPNLPRPAHRFRLPAPRGRGRGRTFQPGTDHLTPSLPAASHRRNPPAHRLPHPDSSGRRLGLRRRRGPDRGRPRHAFRCPRQLLHAAFGTFVQIPSPSHAAVTISTDRAIACSGREGGQMGRTCHGFRAPGSSGSRFRTRSATGIHPAITRPCGPNAHPGPGMGCAAGRRLPPSLGSGPFTPIPREPGVHRHGSVLARNRQGRCRPGALRTPNRARRNRRCGTSRHRLSGDSRRRGGGPGNRWRSRCRDRGRCRCRGGSRGGGR